MDPRGMIGRIYLTGKRTSWVILLTDLNSRIPVTIAPGNRPGDHGWRQQPDAHARHVFAHRHPACRRPGACRPAMAGFCRPAFPSAPWSAMAKADFASRFWPMPRPAKDVEILNFSKPPETPPANAQLPPWQPPASSPRHRRRRQSPAAAATPPARAGQAQAGPCRAPAGNRCHGCPGRDRRRGPLAMASLERAGAPTRFRFLIGAHAAALRPGLYRPDQYSRLGTGRTGAAAASGAGSGLFLVPGAARPDDAGRGAWQSALPRT